MSSQHTAWVLLTLAILGVVIYVQHVTLGRRWQRNEIARRVLGIVTVMGALVPLAAARIIDIVTWAVILGAFIVAGGVIGLCWAEEGARAAEEDARERERKLDAMRREIAGD